MNVQDLIKKLMTMPQTAEVGYIYDGRERQDVEKIWFGRDGRVKLCGNELVVYHDQDRPENAPTEQKKEYWDSGMLKDTSARGKPHEPATAQYCKGCEGYQNEIADMQKEAIDEAGLIELCMNDATFSSKASKSGYRYHVRRAIRALAATGHLKIKAIKAG